LVNPSAVDGASSGSGPTDGTAIGVSDGTFHRDKCWGSDPADCRASIVPWPTDGTTLGVYDGTSLDESMSTKFERWASVGSGFADGTIMGDSDGTSTASGGHHEYNYR
jgi:hypothetical protein